MAASLTVTVLPASRGSVALGGPGEILGPQPCAYRVSLRVGQPDPGDEPVPGAHGLRDEAGRHLDQPELGTAEQPQRPVSGHVPPGQREVTIRADTAHERAGEVIAVVVLPQVYRHLPASLWGVGGHWLGRLPGIAGHGQRRLVFASGVERDVDVAVLGLVAVRLAAEPGQFGALDQHGQRPEPGRRAPSRTRWRRRGRVLLVRPPQP